MGVTSLQDQAFSIFDYRQAGITTLQCICFFCCQGKLDEREETDEYK